MSQLVNPQLDAIVTVSVPALEVAVPLVATAEQVHVSEPEMDDANTVAPLTFAPPLDTQLYVYETLWPSGSVEALPVQVKSSASVGLFPLPDHVTTTVGVVGARLTRVTLLLCEMVLPSSPSVTSTVHSTASPGNSASVAASRVLVPFQISVPPTDQV